MHSFERHENQAVREITRHFVRDGQRQTRLPHPTGAGQDHECDVIPSQQRHDRLDFVLATDQSGAWPWQVRGPRSLSGHLR